MSKILFVGDLNKYGRSYLRFEALKKCGHTVIPIPHTFISEDGKMWRPPFLYRVFCKLRLPLDNMKTNKAIANKIEREQFDIVWIEKGNMVHPWTLREIKTRTQASLISCSEDDMYAMHGHSLWYRWGVRYYDIVFTTKVYNLEELKRLGAKKTVLFLDSYSEDRHKPMKLNGSEIMRFECDVSAIGAFEPQRAESLMYLADNGIKVRVWGSGWKRWVGKHRNMEVRNEFLHGDDYSKAICGTKINISFLRKINRDEVTSRSIEIPACGGFMLAERSSRHCEFFIEGKEAEFFGSNEELLMKTRIYLQEESKRRMIANAGRLRCMESEYSMSAQLSYMVTTAIEGRMSYNAMMMDTSQSVGD